MAESEARIGWIAGRLAVTLAVCAGFSAASPPVSAEGAPPANWAKRYTAIVGAWYLDRRCRVLATPERRELEWLTMQISLAHARRVGFHDVKRYQDLSIKLISADGYTGCGDNNRRIVRESLPWARADLLALTGLTYNPATSYRDFALRRFQLSLARVRISGRCKILSAADAERVAGLERTLVTALADAYGAEAVGAAVRQADAAAARFKPPCATGTEWMVRDAIRDLLEIRREFAR